MNDGPERCRCQQVDALDNLILLISLAYGQTDRMTRTLLRVVRNKTGSLHI